MLNIVNILCILKPAVRPSGTGPTRDWPPANQLAGYGQVSLPGQLSVKFARTNRDNFTRHPVAVLYCKTANVNIPAETTSRKESQFFTLHPFKVLYSQSDIAAMNNSK